MLGWTLSGIRTQLSSAIEKSFLLNTGHEEIEQICDLEVLGLPDTNSESMFNQDFSKNLQQTKVIMKLEFLGKKMLLNRQTTEIWSLKVKKYNNSIAKT